MNDMILNTIRKLARHIEQFLKECKEKGDTTIDDVLKRLEDLKKED